MLCLIAGNPPELKELIHDYRALGVPEQTTRSATYETLGQIPPDDMQDAQIVLELSTTTPSAWQIAQQVKKLAPNASLTLLFRGSPSEAMRRNLESQTHEMGVTLEVVSASNPKHKKDRLKIAAALT
jgi:hypothetical protein